MNYLDEIKKLDNATEMRIWTYDYRKQNEGWEWADFDEAWAFFSAVSHEEHIRTKMATLKISPSWNRWHKILCSDIAGRSHIIHNGLFGNFAIKIHGEETPIRVTTAHNRRLAAEILLEAGNGIFRSIAGRVERKFANGFTPLEREAQAWLDAKAAKR